MSDNTFEDRRAAQLLARVGEDLSSLKHDVRTLLGHTTRHTIPDGARHLARSGGERLASGRDQALAGARRVSHVAREHPAGISLGGLVLLGAVAFGAYLWLKGDCCRSTVDEFLDDHGP